MNIKILEPIREHLIIGHFPFGSRVYGTYTASSDYDFIVLLNCSLGDCILQYTSPSKNEYIYTGQQEFIRDVLNGKSAPNFEAMHTDEFMEHANWKDPTEILIYYTYEMAKCYLGLAKRDLDYPDRLFHVNRSIWMAQQIMDKNLIDLSRVKDIPIIDNIPGLKMKVKAMRKELVEKHNVQKK
jgi:hypothetical protein